MYYIHLPVPLQLQCRLSGPATTAAAAALDEKARIASDQSTQVVCRCHCVCNPQPLLLEHQKLPESESCLRTRARGRLDRFRGCHGVEFRNSLTIMASLAQEIGEI